jgi:hypothetical protein
MTKTACSVCGNLIGSLYGAEYPGGTCSQECARTFAIVEVGRELLKLLCTMAMPTYYIDKLPLISQEDAARIVASGAGTSPSVPPFARTPLPPEPPWGDGPKPDWWDKADY